MAVVFLGTVGRGKVGRTQYVEYKTHTRGQDNDLYYPKIGGRVASLVATVAHVNSLMDMSNQWCLSMLRIILLSIPKAIMFLIVSHVSI